MNCVHRCQLERLRLDERCYASANFTKGGFRIFLHPDHLPSLIISRRNLLEDETLSVINASGLAEVSSQSGIAVAKQVI